MKKTRCFDIGSEYYASPWLLTFFAVLSPQKHRSSTDSINTAFDLNFVLTAIDLFLLEGIISLIRICLGILSAIKGKNSLKSSI